MGEEVACSFLLNRGYRILERNFFSKYGEIDIIAYKKCIVIFVEVKTRKNDYYSYASQSINNKKIRNIKLTSQVYLFSNNLFNYDYRYDVIECYWKDKKIIHIKDAF